MARWANQQALFLRSGNFASLDIEHLAEETGLSVRIFPATCPYALSDALADGWLPE